MMINQLKCCVFMQTIHFINTIGWIVMLIWCDTGAYESYAINKMTSLSDHVNH